MCGGAVWSSELSGRPRISGTPTTDAPSSPSLTHVHRRAQRPRSTSGPTAGNLLPPPPAHLRGLSAVRWAVCRAAGGGLRSVSVELHKCFCRPAPRPRRTGPLRSVARCSGKSGVEMVRACVSPGHPSLLWSVMAPSAYVVCVRVRRRHRIYRMRPPHVRTPARRGTDRCVRVCRRIHEVKSAA